MHQIYVQNKKKHIKLRLETAIPNIFSFKYPAALLLFCLQNWITLYSQHKTKQN
jgi:hypothetical protein